MTDPPKVHILIGYAYVDIVEYARRERIGGKQYISVTTPNEAHRRTVGWDLSRDIYEVTLVTAPPRLDEILFVLETHGWKRAGWEG